MADKYYNQAVALSGLIQAIHLVITLANKGEADEELFEPMVHSILQLRSSNISEVYNGVSKVKLGAKILLQYLSQDKNLDYNDYTRYFIKLRTIHKKLIKDTRRLKQLEIDVTRAQHQALNSGFTHDNVILTLAESYLDNISTIEPRVKVIGKHENLGQPIILNKIRTLLLAAMRSYILWRQYDGSTLNLFFNRKKVEKHARQIASL